MKYLIQLILLVVCFMSPVASTVAQPLKTENVILITADGLRIQELFGGMDEIILNDQDKSGVENTSRLRGKYWLDTAKERREALFPFFWKELSKHGVILGNQELGSVVELRNQLQFSYPGYAEILTGMPQPRIVSNLPIQNPVPTILDYVKEQLNLNETQVAAVCSWSVFRAICSTDKDNFFINAGYQDVPEQWATEKMKFYNQMQIDIRTPWDSVRHDMITFNIALEWLKEYKPRLLYIGEGETDDWAHARRYDRVIETANYFDQSLRQLWETLQSMEQYKDKTTLIITTDHGRGITPDDWTDHNLRTPGSDDIWIAVFGPDTPNHGEMSNTTKRYQASVAATLLKFYGLDWKDYNPDIDPPVDEAFE